MQWINNKECKPIDSDYMGQFFCQILLNTNLGMGKAILGSALITVELEHALELQKKL